MIGTKSTELNNYNRNIPFKKHSFIKTKRGKALKQRLNKLDKKVKKVREKLENIDK
jgi:hypothetical protein